MEDVRQKCLRTSTFCQLPNKVLYKGNWTVVGPISRKHTSEVNQLRTDCTDLSIDLGSGLGRSLVQTGINLHFNSKHKMSDSSWARPKGSRRGGGWGRSEEKRFAHPKHLRGRDIGLYYRDKQVKKEPSKYMRTMSISLPSTVLNTLSKNLKLIKKIAKEENIKLDTSKVKVKTAIISEESQNAIPSTSYKVEKCELMDISKDDKIKSSSCDIKKENSEEEFIPVSQGCSSDYGSEKILSLRGAGDYKYSYEDIINGTFVEKLEESLSNGIPITFSNKDTEDLNAAMHYEYKDMVDRSNYKKMMKFRENLPAYKKSEEILKVINNNQVTVISGETGCGKSTQVPQLILDEAIKNQRGANVKILVTQPRRIAAITLASRVADERAEPMGNSVGYAVRLERQECRPRGSIMFCTTGILLADLEVNQGLTNYSHIILDEVHERDCHIDLSMCMLKQVLMKRTDLKIILMSATLDADKLSQFFGNCPLLHIEGLAYPVKDIYLEDILEFTKYRLPEEKNKYKNLPIWQQKRDKRKISNAMEKTVQYRAEIDHWLQPKKKHLDRQVYETLSDARIEDLNIDLLVELLIYICKGDPGAILVFLPGIGDIKNLLRKMQESNFFPESSYAIYPIHSKLPTLQQRKIFDRPPENIRKIIVATNIAETSITIDDIVYVVDCGKIKMSGLNVEDNISTLQTEWVSQANLRQRRGRAGRCQPGICYHLLTSYRSSKLEERLLPELQRSNLLEPVLMVKKLRLGKAEKALNMVPDPPAQSTIQWAVQYLQRCGALDDTETLTPLGWHLARLPVHPSAGKLLLFGALFGCLDQAASIAAIWGFKDPFQLVIGKEREVDDAKRSLAMGEPSDHIAMSEALIEFERRTTFASKKSFAYDFFLSYNTLELLSEMKHQLGNNLKQMGFLPSGSVKSSWENRNAGNYSLFKAVIVASLYPNVATASWKGLKSKKPNRPAFVVAHTPEDGKVQIHPSSVVSKRIPRRNDTSIPESINPGANWLVYWLKQKSSELYLIDVTLVYTLPLLFFGELKIIEEGEDLKPDECYINITKVRVRCKTYTAVLLLELRSMLEQVLASRVNVDDEHSTKHNKFDEQVLKAVVDLITAEDEQTEFDDGDYSESDHSESEPTPSKYRNKRY